MIAAGPRISGVSFEHHHNGLGVNTSLPRISWAFTEPPEKATGWEQEEYEIELKRNGPAEPEKYRIRSPESVLVPWPSQPLVSRERVQVRVRTHGRFKSDNMATVSDWSNWSPVEAAFLSRDDWVAKFIASSDANSRLAADGSLIPMRFRKTFQLPNRKVARARLYITAHGVYQVYVGGHPVSQDVMAPGWTSYNHRLYYQTHDITGLLNVGGETVIGIELAEGWYAGRLGWAGGRRYRFGDNIAVLAQLEVHFDEAAADLLTIASDETWQSTPSAITQSEIYNGETYDARQEDKSWASTNIVSSATTAWTAVQVGKMPKSQLISPDSPPVRITEELSPKSIFTTPSGKIIVDFGQNLVGKIRVNALHKPQGHEVVFSHAEVLENGELGVRPLRGAKSVDSLTSNGAEIINWTPLFTFHGFRYVQVDGWSPDDKTSPLSKSSLTALVLHTDMKRTGWFSCSHPMVNKLHDNALWSMRGNFLSIPTDCPQRDERLGWTGDIQIFSPSANFLYDTSAMLGGWLEDVASEQLKERDGAIPPFVVPNVIQRNDENVRDEWWLHSPCAVWDDVAVIAPWDIYRAFGDVAILQKQYESMKAWVDRGIRRGHDGLWDPECPQLGDWLDPMAPPDEPGHGRTDPVLVADAYLVRVTWIIAQVASACGYQSDVMRYSEEYESLKQVFQQRYITSSGLLVADSQTAIALAIRFNLFATPQQRQFAAARLIRSVRQAQFRVSTGFAGTPIITHALTAVGRPQYAYRMLLEKRCPSWMYPISMGATTIWERWDSMLPDGSINPGEMTSFNHYALGSIVNWLHESVGGISPLKPGYKEILVRPVPGASLTHAAVTYNSPYGKIEASWQLKEKKDFTLQLLVPPNTKAYVVLPDRQSTSATEEDQEGVWVASGRHEFTSQFVPNDEWPPAAITPEFWPQPPPQCA